MNTVLSFGAGVQTTALLVLIAEGRWPRPDAIVFSDTGSEKQATYDYLSEVAVPYAARYGLTIDVLGGEWRINSARPSLEGYCRQYHIVPSTMHRWCTDKFKVHPIRAFRRERFGSGVIETWIGISTDEARRAKVSQDATEVKRYPLIELDISRAACVQLIRDAGLPVPPKSGCWFCPYQRRGEWRQLKREQYPLFLRALELERTAKPHANGKPRYLPVFGSLELIAGQDELPGFDEAMTAEAGCVSGACFV